MFDLEKGSTLYIDLAKSNSRSKRSRPGLLLVKLFRSCLPFSLIMHFIWFVTKFVCFVNHYEQMMKDLAQIRELKDLRFHGALILVRSICIFAQCVYRIPFDFSFWWSILSNLSIN